MFRLFSGLTPQFHSAALRAEEALRTSWRLERDLGERTGPVTILDNRKDLVMPSPLEKRRIDAAGGPPGPPSALVDLGHLVDHWGPYLDLELESLERLPTSVPLRISSFFVATSTFPDRLREYWGRLFPEPSHDETGEIPLFAQLFFPEPKTIRGLLICLHGLGENHRSWHRAAAGLAEQGIATLIFDRRGAGYSSAAGQFLFDSNLHVDDFGSILQATIGIMYQYFSRPVPFGTAGFSAGATTLFRSLYTESLHKELNYLVGLILASIAVFGFSLPHFLRAKKGLERAERIAMALLGADGSDRQDYLERRLSPGRRLTLLTEFGLPDRSHMNCMNFSAAGFSRQLAHSNVLRWGKKGPEKRWEWMGLPPEVASIPILGFADRRDRMSKSPLLRRILGPERYQMMDAFPASDRTGDRHIGILETEAGLRAFLARADALFSDQNPRYEAERKLIASAGQRLAG